MGEIQSIIFNEVIVNYLSLGVKTVFRFIILVVFAFMASPANAELMLFGGEGHKVFLGCVSCHPRSAESICNEYGRYGSEYNSESIWNAYATYGNEYLSTSPWNKYTSTNTVPVLVDGKGSFYGYFTINVYRSNAVNFAETLSKMFDNAQRKLPIVRNLL